MLAHDEPLQAEFADGLARFDRLAVADVGCRTFLFAPVIERCFAAHGLRVELHGIELDAFRRFTDLRTRQDHGRFYAALVDCARPGV